MELIVETLGSSGIIILGVVLIILGYIGSVMPAMPGAPLALCSVLLLHFTKLYQYHWAVLVALIILTLTISFADYVLPIWGTKKFGGTKSGMKGSSIGLIIGVVVGFILPVAAIVTLLGGAFLGAFIGEKMNGAENKFALKSATGSLLGFLAGTFGKVLVCTIITIVFGVGVFNILT